MTLAVASMSLGENPNIDQWLDFSKPGRVTLLTGKVEIGQGIETALLQIAADTLGVPVDRFDLRSGETHATPNEGYTAGSTSIEIGGSAVKLAASAARQVFLEAAARHLETSPDRLSVLNGRIFFDSAPTELDYWILAPSIDLGRVIEVEASWADASSGLLGKNVERVDLLAKISGAAFVHDIDLPDMLHGRVLRPPSFTARLTALDVDAFKARCPHATAWRNGDFVAVVAAKEYDAVTALEVVRACSTWRESDDLPRVDTWSGYLAAQPSIDDATEAGQLRPGRTGLKRVRATYSRPPIAHASIAPSCAVAHWDSGRLQIFTASQNVFNLRAAIAKALDLELDKIQVAHRHSAGCYGHNGSDDSAMDAALLAMAFAPHPVRLQWTREDELTWAPFGSAMAVTIEAAVDDEGRIADWSTEIWSGTHCKRPAFLPGLVDLLAASHMDPPMSMSSSRETPLAFVGSDRNAEPPYALPRLQIMRHKLPELPFRFSSLRTLGGFANVFAIECFMDELADAAGVDPIEFRLQHLEDPRARAVTEAVARMAESGPAPSSTSSVRGFAYSRYKNTAAYLAAIAEVDVDEDVRVSRVFAAVDAGLPINPDGLINQIEGGVIQSISWALMEQVTFDSRSITSGSWDRYPILRFDAAPDVAVQIVDHGGNPPLGVGEAAQGPAAAAVANAVARATGGRVRELPLTRENMIRSLDR